MEEFFYSLEEHLHALQRELTSGTYRHGHYRVFTVSDNKRRSIAVAPLRDRFVHRLLYEELEKIYDPVFIDDVWSCRKGKGLIGAIDRAQQFLGRFRQGFFWRADILKFFDNVDHGVLWECLERRIGDQGALSLLQKIIDSYPSDERPAFARRRASADEERERERVLWRGGESPSATSRARFSRTSTCMNSIGL